MDSESSTESTNDYLNSEDRVRKINSNTGRDLINTKVKKLGLIWTRGVLISHKILIYKTIFRMRNAQPIFTFATVA